MTSCAKIFSRSGNVDSSISSFHKVRGLCYEGAKVTSLKGSFSLPHLSVLYFNFIQFVHSILVIFSTDILVRKQKHFPSKQPHTMREKACYIKR